MRLMIFGNVAALTFCFLSSGWAELVFQTLKCRWSLFRNTHSRHSCSHRDSHSDLRSPYTQQSQPNYFCSDRNTRRQNVLHTFHWQQNRWEQTGCHWCSHHFSVFWNTTEECWNKIKDIHKNRIFVRVLVTFEWSDTQTFRVAGWRVVNAGGAFERGLVVSVKLDESESSLRHLLLESRRLSRHHVYVFLGIWVER